MALYPSLYPYVCHRFSRVQKIIPRRSLQWCELTFSDALGSHNKINNPELSLLLGMKKKTCIIYLEGVLDLVSIVAWVRRRSTYIYVLPPPIVLIFSVVDSPIHISDTNSCNDRVRACRLACSIGLNVRILSP